MQRWFGYMNMIVFLQAWPVSPNSDHKIRRGNCIKVSIELTTTGIGTLIYKGNATVIKFIV